MNNLGIIRKPFQYRFYNATMVLIGLNVLVFVIGLFWKVYLPLQRITLPGTDLYLGLRPPLVLKAGYVWQVFTYMFVHGDFYHIFFNMLGLLIFGAQLEKRMGSSEFLLLYLFTGIGTGLFSLLLGMNNVFMGASGAIYALLLAFAVYFPDARIGILFVPIPMRAPIFVVVFIVMSLVFHFTGLFGRMSHLGHLAGIALSYLYFLVRIGINPIRHFIDRR